MGTGGSTAETYSVEFGYDYAHPDFTAGRATSVSVGYAGPKQSGWKLELSGTGGAVQDGHELETSGGVGVNLQGPANGSRKYDITDKDDIDYVLGRLANLDKIRQVNVGAQAAANLTFIPTTLQEEYGKFLAALQRLKARASRTPTHSPRGSRFPIGGEITVGPFKLGLSKSVKADAKVGRLRQRGQRRRRAQLGRREIRRVAVPAARTRPVGQRGADVAGPRELVRAAVL